MKKLTIFLIIPLLSLLLPHNVHAVSIKLPQRDSIVTLTASDALPIRGVINHGFNKIILMLPDIRNPKPPYNTNYTNLRTLYKSISEIEKSKLKYILCFTKGPGYSKESDISSVFTNNMELNYFSKMIKEVLLRYHTSKYLWGVSIELEADSITPREYYSLQDHLLGNIKTAYPKLELIYNLAPLTFENNYIELPIKPDPTKLYNLDVNFTAMTYPGYGTAYKSTYTLTKNALLKSFVKYKDYITSNKLRTIISYNTPWDKNSDIFLQDSYEIFKMLKFDLNLYYGNYSGANNIFSTKPLIKVIDRNNK